MKESSFRAVWLLKLWNNISLKDMQAQQDRSLRWSWVWQQAGAGTIIDNKHWSTLPVILPSSISEICTKLYVSIHTYICYCIYTYNHLLLADSTVFHWVEQLLKYDLVNAIHYLPDRQCADMTWTWQQTDNGWIIWQKCAEGFGIMMMVLGGYF